ncbi:response regulator transcription factor [Isobaculum melis]|uniref:DNA-binding response regulator, OmpR family, contains REC and winged-helix (WHTH) domain n=1 Tax=Isobaculum melis TaxID=142588 RepID=A0A1H9QJE9_9LACT|nr:response regulator transcription factor [Isobaculum melis]SER60537.1 DNA-binding response regulator, OmpR family, contains REC and winged-helix (wHTH) domain [Isobaculum melis]
MIKETILIIEDDVDISQMIEERLLKEGYQVFCAYDGEEALTLFHQQTIHFILLDLMMPKLDGMQFLQEIRKEHTTPVMIISAKDSEIDKALGLGFGADDYLTKPFSMLELVARVQATLRRVSQYQVGEVKQVQKEAEVIKIGALEIEKLSFSVKKNGEALKLTSKEFNILDLLVSSPKQVFTKAQIYEHVWAESYYGDENVINVHMRRLREKIEDEPSKPVYIQTIWGIGYKLGDNL